MTYETIRELLKKTNKYAHIDTVTNHVSIVPNYNLRKKDTIFVVNTNYNIYTISYYDNMQYIVLIKQYIDEVYKKLVKEL